MIFASFVRVVYPLKYPSNACFSCLDNGCCCWNAIYLECQNVRYLTSKQVSCHNKTLKYLSNIKALISMPLSEHIILYIAPQ